MKRKRYTAYVTDELLGHNNIDFYADGMRDACEFALQEYGDSLVGVVLAKVTKLR